MFGAEAVKCLISTKSICLIFLLLCSAGVAAKPLIVTHKYASKGERFIVDVLLRALSSGTRESYQLKAFPVEMDGSQLALELEVGNLDVFWGVESLASEERLLAIATPLHKWRATYFVSTRKRLFKSQFVSDHYHYASSLCSGLSGGLSNMRPSVTSSLSEGIVSQFFTKYRAGALESEKFILSNKESDFEHVRNSGCNKRLEYSPVPVYFFVESSNKELASAISTGLWVLMQRGEFNKVNSAFSHIEHARLYAGTGF